ncbi:MAG: long-chain fatty acid transport protein [Rhodocyclaceae bacterium]|nr:MAG: long-chain fatty acid transport protein [Rhodocyclaceae bacterium]
MNRTKLRLIPALIAIAFSGSAAAAGFQLLEQNASGLGNAYAGSAAVADNASTIFYNPAGMTQLKDIEVSTGVSLVSASYKFNDNGSSTGALSGNSDGGTDGYIPNAYLSWRVAKDISVGLGIGAPFGLMTDYNNPWYGAAQSDKFQIKTINVNPSIAWRANDWLSIGGGVNYQTIDAEYVRAVAITNGALATTTATLKLNDTAWGWNAGLLFTLNPATKVGVSYRSTIKYEVTGDVALSGPAAAALSAGGAASDVKASVKLPDTFILSGTHKFSDQWEVLGDLSWTGWSSIPKIDVIRTSGIASGQLAQRLDTEFRDSWRVAAGANYQLNEAWKLKFGVAYDQTPVKGATTRLVSLPDNDRVWFSIGTQWKPAKNTTIDVGATYLLIKDADINNNQTVAVVDAATAAQNRGTVKGTYDDKAIILGAQLSMAF